jgi:hypothetical protein
MENASTKPYHHAKPPPAAILCRVHTTTYSRHAKVENNRQGRISKIVFQHISHDKKHRQRNQEHPTFAALKAERKHRGRDLV